MFDHAFVETDEGWVLSVVVLYLFSASAAYYENEEGAHATLGLRFGHLEFAPTLSLWTNLPAPLPLWIAKARSALRRTTTSR